MTDFEAFKTHALKVFPSLDEERLSRFEAMGQIYREWNEKINVISRKDMDAFYFHHVLHSLALARCFEREGISPDEDFSILDLGTGGGFPGVPLAVIYPKWHFTLCDSIAKKTLVASEAAKALGLSNVEVVTARAESLTANYDFVVSRAVASLDKLCSWIWPRLGGSLFCLKGGDLAQEISDLVRLRHIPAGKISVWKPDCFPADEYFDEKFVIKVEKNYLCSPIREKYKNIIK